MSYYIHYLKPYCVRIVRDHDKRPIADVSATAALDTNRNEAQKEAARQMVDYANIGEAFVDAIAKHDPDACWNECPTEVYIRALNDIFDKDKEIAQLQAHMQRIKSACEENHAAEAAVVEIVSLCANAGAGVTTSSERQQPLAVTAHHSMG